jgi:hypothetical protein
MLDLSFTKVNVNLVSAEVGVKDGVNFRNIVFSHHSESL